MSEILERENEQIYEIKSWEDKDLDLLFKINAPEMMEHLEDQKVKNRF
jgi:hypothetical protein